jgi:DICT domain-containing protein
MAFDRSRAEFYRQTAARLRKLAQASEFPEFKAQLEKMTVQYQLLASEVDRGRWQN